MTKYRKRIFTKYWLVASQLPGCDLVLASALLATVTILVQHKALVMVIMLIMIMVMVMIMMMAMVVMNMLIVVVLVILLPFTRDHYREAQSPSERIPP